MTYAEAMRRYGFDKPDLRIDLELVDVADLVGLRLRGVHRPANDRTAGSRAAIPVARALSRKQIDEYAAHAAKFGAKGLAYAKIDEAGAATSPVASSFAEGAFEALLAHVGAGNGDLVFFGAGACGKVKSDFMGAVRLKAGKDFGLVAGRLAPLWVTDFPMFEWDAEGSAGPCTTCSRASGGRSRTCARMRRPR